MATALGDFLNAKIEALCPNGLRMQLSEIQNPNEQPHSVVLYDAREQHWLHFHSPIATLTASCPTEILPLLNAVQQQVNQGYYAAGFMSYEASPAFDPSFRVQPCPEFPLAWFGLYTAPQVISLPPVAPETDSRKLPKLDWTASISREQYRAALDQIKRHIARGETYQVNFSFRLRSRFSSDPWLYFIQLMQAQASRYGAFVNLEHWAICSASPELFFDLSQISADPADSDPSGSKSRLTCRPMKGTAPRGLSTESDRQLATALQQSEKNRAENLMIVDMIRNDMGRIAQTGTVQVNRLFEVEQYPTLWQMTSPVQCLTQANLVQIFQALFPCASITGAPKSRTLQIIADLEDSPRRIYTGAIGFVTPQHRAQFNVAIRTVLVDKVLQVAEYGVGGGIVWDSIETSEFEECCTKAKILSRQPAFDLLESLRWTPAQGYFLLDLHLQRLRASAAYFAFAMDEEAVREQLEAIVPTLPPTPQKVRLRVSKQGEIQLEAVSIEPELEPLKVEIAAQPVQSSDLFLYHKTTHRQVYNQARQRSVRDDVLLWNERGELTEFCTANLVIEREGQWYTPPIQCGLLAGTFRAWLLQEGKLQECVIHPEDLKSCSRVFLVNSVQKMREAIVLPSG